MREIILDTETTGLDPLRGDRLVEIGGIELVNHFPTGRTYHVYINPERDMPEEAFRVTASPPSSSPTSRASPTSWTSSGASSMAPSSSSTTPRSTWASSTPS